MLNHVIRKVLLSTEAFNFLEKIVEKVQDKDKLNAICGQFSSS